MTPSTELAGGDPVLVDAIARARKLLRRRAVAGAAASVVPLPGIDWIVDAALLSKLIPAINAEFGLTPQQLRQLPPRQREAVQKAVGVVGSLVIGRVVTRDLVLRMAKALGRRMTVKQATKYVPIAGQAVSALIGYTAICYLGEGHIRDCVEVCRRAQLLPAPERP